MARTIIPFGPQHPVLPEPIHLTLVLEDDIVQEVLPSIGYCHRGIEKACERNPYWMNPRLVERVCGICNFMHAQAYSEAVEKALEVEVPPRAKYLRVIWAELNRVRSHLLWLGLLADAMGFESLFMQFWRIREKSILLIEKTTGNRIIFSTAVVGGVNKDIPNDYLQGEFSRVLNEIKKEVLELITVLLKDPTIKARAVGKGVLSKENAQKLGAVGPTARGSGLHQDMRLTGHAAYPDLDFEPVVEKEGDSYARAMVRAREVLQSIELIREAIGKIPEGELSIKIDRWPEKEAFSRIEQPRGELIYYIKGNGTRYLERVKIRTPTFSNIPPLLTMLPGCEMADVPVITLSIDPCIGCTER
jgi:ech hydrogenase subunit E